MARKKVMKWRSGCRVAWKPSGAWVGCGAFSKEVYLSCLLLKSVHTALVRSLRNRPHVDCETIGKRPGVQFKLNKQVGVPVTRTTKALLQRIDTSGGAVRLMIIREGGRGKSGRLCAHCKGGDCTVQLFSC